MVGYVIVEGGPLRPIASRFRDARLRGRKGPCAQLLFLVRGGLVLELLDHGSELLQGGGVLRAGGFGDWQRGSVCCTAWNIAPVNGSGTQP